MTREQEALIRHAMLALESDMPGEAWMALHNLLREHESTWGIDPLVTRKVPTLIHDGKAWVEAAHFDVLLARVSEAMNEHLEGGGS